ncbi:MAG TPA: sugar ABC transporter permease [Thermotogota bacterium]|nr:sugar ABC transporter permease [Thermotogota bacterium]HRW92825.1 sugar ABC transporter permease [Thermotogota bacterium]
MKRMGQILALLVLALGLFLAAWNEVPLLPGVWQEFFEYATPSELLGGLFLVGGILLAGVVLGVSLWKRRTLLAGLLGVSGGMLLFLGAFFLESYFRNWNPFPWIFLGLALLIGSLLIFASGIRKVPQRRVQTYVIAFMFLLLPLTIMGIFTFYPLFRGVVLSFAKYNMINGKTQWIGLKNFQELFDDKYFYISLQNTFKYLVVVIPIQFFSLALSVLVNQKIPGIKFFRTMFYLPVITGAVIVSLTWKWIYAQDGLLNYILMSWHLIKEPVLWLTDKNTALWAAMFVTLWRGLGYYMIIYLAGLQNIPSDLYEAASIDGATGWTRFFSITLPLMRPTILLCSVLSTMAAFQVFEEIFLLTGGANSTSTLAFEVYDRAFVRYNFGESAALAIVLSLMISVFTVINFKFFGAGKKAKA